VTSGTTVVVAVAGVGAVAPWAGTAVNPVTKVPDRIAPISGVLNQPFRPALNGLTAVLAISREFCAIVREVSTLADNKV